MKIGVLVSSYDETNSPFAEFDEYQNPGIYVKTHEFHLRVVTKKNAKEQIDRIVEEGFDYIWNFLWGLPDDNIAGIDEVKYLESKNVPMLGASSKYLLLTKLDQKNAIASAGLKTPKGIAIKGDEVSLPQLDLGDLQFPLISKPAVGCGSEFLTEQSVCSNLTKLWTQIEILKSKVNCEILIEEFIDGQEVACIVLETRNGNIALEPLIYEFPDNYPSTKRFLDFQKKFAGVETGEVKYKIFDGDASLKKNIQETAIKAYESLGVLGSGYARVDIRIRGSDLYVLEINHTPAFFAKIGNTYGDDFTIESTFPGGHERLVEEIITSKRRFDAFLQVYNEIANVYDDEILIKNGKCLVEAWTNLIETFDFSGTVLDLGCGTGMVGNVIKKKYDAKVTGIDASPEMVKSVRNYEKLHVGLIENVVMEMQSKFNHIVNSCGTMFVDKKYFEKLLSQIFDLANDSITLTIDDISEEYQKSCKEKKSAFVFNHANTVNNLPLPTGWFVAYKQRKFIWESPIFNTQVFGLVIRYEKIKS